MKNLQGVFSSLVAALHTLLIIAVPLFFLSTTQEFYATNKMYLLGFGVLAILVVLTLNFLVNKKVSWVNSPMDTVLIAFVILYAGSLMIASPNKVQAALNPTHGLAVIIFLTLFYFITVHYFTGKKEDNAQSFFLTPINALQISAFLAAVAAIFFFFEPFKGTVLPFSLSFLSSPQFTPLGTPVDLAIFLGFFVVFGITNLIEKKDQKPEILSIVVTIVITVATILTIYTLVKPIPQPKTSAVLKGPTSIIASLPPFSVSWYAALETLKDWKTAFFGVGIDNFAAIFTKVKPLTYNSTPLWRVNFTEGRSFLLELWAEGGLLTLAAFGLFLTMAFRMSFVAKRNKSILDNQQFSSVAHLLGHHSHQESIAIELGFLYTIVAMVFFPASLPLLFILFILLSYIASHQSRERMRTTDLTHLAPVVGLLVVVAFIAIGAASYFLGRAYLAEFYFKDSINNLAQNQGQNLYENMRQAIVLNPYIERYRLNFSQLNLLIANNIASSKKNPKDLTDIDRQNITQAIQAAIAESKAAVALNPTKSSNWENLAAIYRNIINVAQGADQWTLASYQQAMLLDPQNPILPLNLGGVFYSFNGYKNAAQLFERAVSLKPDWPNAHYNLAWAYFQEKDYVDAVTQMQNVISLLDPTVDKQDYQRAQADLKEFSKSLPAQNETGATTPQPQNLALPTPPVATVEPKIKLPKEANPPQTTPTPSESPSGTPSPSPSPAQ